MTIEWIVRNIFVGAILMFLLGLIFKKKQDRALNWAMFYSTLWVLISILLVNALCVKLGFWQFNDKASLPVFIPFDILFVWVSVWGALLTYFLRASYIWMAALALFWLDLLFMPQLQSVGVLSLGEYWIVGEVLMILCAFVPAQMWARVSLKSTKAWFRSSMQFISMAITWCIGIPFITLQYFPKELDFGTWYIPYIVQIGFIIALPSIIAVIDLYERGRGTPFPYDPTSVLVRTGAYAYIRNPIQWTLTFIFIPLAVIYSSPVLIAGIVVSLGYTFGVANPQEDNEMKKRFGVRWTEYKVNVPAWYFQWRPANIPVGTIYFNETCRICTKMRNWFESRGPVNLNFEHASKYPDEQILQVTYVDEHTNVYSSVKAIANALEHINLAWASLGWFMRLPGIAFVLQTIVNSMNFGGDKAACI